MMAQLRAARIALGACIVTCLVFVSPDSGAANTTTGTISLNATVASELTVAPIIFPLITGYTSSSSQLTVNLPSGDPFTISLASGTSGTCTARTLTDGAGHFVPYQLYTDAALTSIWCGGATGTPLSATGTGVNQALPFYLVVTPNGAPPGTYNDALIATITF